MQIIDKIRVYQDDVRSIFHTNILALPNDDLILSASGPFVDAAESYVIDLIAKRGGDWTKITPQTEVNADFVYLHWACIYQLCCLAYDQVFSPEIIKEKSPDYEYVRDHKAVETNAKRICGQTEFYLRKLKFPIGDNVALAVVSGTGDSDYINRADGV